MCVYELCGLTLVPIGSTYTKLSTNIFVGHNGKYKIHNYMIMHNEGRGIILVELKYKKGKTKIWCAVVSEPKITKQRACVRVMKRITLT